MRKVKEFHLEENDLFYIKSAICFSIQCYEETLRNPSEDDDDDYLENLEKHYDALTRIAETLGWGKVVKDGEI